MKKSETVGFQIRCTANVVDRFIQQEYKNCSNDRITKMQVWIIDYITDSDVSNIYQRDIEKEFRIRRSTATEVLKLMEKNNLIVRENVKDDLRLKKIALTDKARKLYEENRKKVEQLELKLVNGISEEEKIIFFDIMNRIRKNAGDLV